MEMLKIYASIDSPGVILVLLIVFFGVIAGITLLLHYVVPGMKDRGGHVNEDVAIQEELDRVLEPITDEEVLKAMQQQEKPKDEE